MSQIAHSWAPLSAQLKAYRLVLAGLLFALLATAAVVLVLAIEGGSSSTPVADQA